MSEIEYSVEKFNPKEDTIKVYYQLIYSFKLKKYIGAEALLRVFDKNNKLYHTALMVEAAEANNYINEIFEKVVEIAGQDDAIAKFERVFINVSPYQLEDNNAAENIRDIVVKNNLNIYNVIFEITEGWSGRNQEILVENVNKLRSYGFNIAIDDYNLGKSLDYLKMGIHFDILKIDKKIVKDYHKNEAFLTKILKTLRSSGIEIIAEGIEIVEEETALMGYGYTSFQGYLYSVPKPIEDFT